MTRKEQFTVFCLAVAVVTGTAGFAALEDGGTSGRRKLVVPLELTPQSRSRVRLNREEVLVSLPTEDQLQRVNVRMYRTHYHGRILEIGEGRRRERDTELTCYELSSEQPYGWTVWSEYGFARWRVFTDEKGTVLAWVDGVDVRLADITEPRDRCVALREHYEEIGRPPGRFVPVGELVPEAADWRAEKGAMFGDATHHEIDVTEVKRGRGAHIRVRVADPATGEGATLLYDGKEWSRED
ncbi:MAG: hypothetical protein R6X33_08475 [Candidatus Brocadiia bacterium]